MRATVLMAGVCLALGGCAYNIKPVGPTDVTAIRPVVGGQLRVLADTAYSGYGAANYSAETITAFRNSGVFAEVTQDKTVAKTGYTIAVSTESNGPETNFPSSAGGAAFTFVLLPVIPWRFEGHYADVATVYYCGREVAKYRMPYSVQLLVSVNPAYYLLGQPARFGGVAEQGGPKTRKFLASRNVGWILSRMQADGLLSGGAK